MQTLINSVRTDTFQKLDAFNSIWRKDNTKSNSLMNVTFQKLGSSTIQIQLVTWGRTFFWNKTFLSVAIIESWIGNSKKSSFLSWPFWIFFFKQKIFLLDPHENQSQLCNRMDGTQFLCFLHFISKAEVSKHLHSFW